MHIKDYKKSTSTKGHIMKSSESTPTLLSFCFPIPEAKTLHVCLEVNSSFPSNVLFLLFFNFDAVRHFLLPSCCLLGFPAPLSYHCITIFKFPVG